jgi:hypothetical protein
MLPGSATALNTVVHDKIYLLDASTFLVRSTGWDAALLRMPCMSL